jgi:hypothetical protein
MIIFVSFNFLAFWPFPWQRQPFWKNQPYAAQLHMAYDIPTRFHKVWSRYLREIEQILWAVLFIVTYNIYIFNFLNFLMLLCPPNFVWETYCVCSVSYYYYVTLTVVGWCIAILRFLFTIIIILIILLLIIILPHIFVCSISRRYLDQTLWNLVGISYAMWSCAA